MINRVIIFDLEWIHLCHLINSVSGTVISAGTVPTMNYIVLFDFPTQTKK